MKEVKLKNLTNKELMESALAEIEDLGYHIIKPVLGNSYFIFEGDDNTICHFFIKEIPRV